MTEPPQTDATAALVATRTRLREFVSRRVPAGIEADDIVQDVLTRLVERQDDVSPEKVQAWALTSARNAIVDQLRRRRPVELEDEVAAPDGDEVATDLARCLRPLLELLDEEDRWILEQVDAGGRSQAELARELGVSVSTVKSRVQRARRRLRTVIDRCCEIELDAYGTPIDARRRDRRSCGDCDPAPAPSGTTRAFAPRP